MGFWFKLACSGGVAAVAVAMGLRIAPDAHNRGTEVDVALDVPAHVSALMAQEIVPASPALKPLAPRQTTLAVPVPKPAPPAKAVTQAALTAPRADTGLPRFSGNERPAPSGYIDFCRRRPDICTVGGARQVALSDAAWTQLVSVNSYYDETIEPKTDMEALGLIEHWDIPSGPHPVGDCEDFALAKKAQLIALGWPRSALLLAVANIPEADPAARRHAVLIVVTDHGNFVLDNRRLKILTWEEAGYDWVSIQSPTDAYKWVAISTDANSKLVTASGVPDITRAR